MSHDNHHGDHDPNLSHHWENMEQQFNAGKLGMWLFLVQEVLFFSGLFCAYVIYRYNNPEMYEYASQFLDTKWGALNTVVLLISSLTMAMAVRNAQKSQNGLLIMNLILTFVCAGGFMVIKGIEYTAKYEHGTLPGRSFDWDKVLTHEAHTAGHGEHAAGSAENAEAQVAKAPVGVPKVDPTTHKVPGSEPLGFSDHPESGPLSIADNFWLGLKKVREQDGTNIQGDRPPNLHIFFGIYFGMTGLHGIHVLAGMVMIIWLLFGAFKGRFHSGYFTPVDLGALYWHIVDLIWIFLFPLLYLI